MSRTPKSFRSTTVLLVRRAEHVALAGASADAFSLLARFEGKLEQYHGNLERAAIELSKEWRTDKVLRHLEALLVVADTKSSFLLSGNGDVIAPDEGVLAIGS